MKAHVEIPKVSSLRDLIRVVFFLLFGVLCGVLCSGGERDYCGSSPQFAGELPSDSHHKRW